MALLYAFISSITAAGQGCPANIDFETGTFDGWTCYTGSVAAVNGQNVITLSPSGGPVFNRHTMYSSFPGDGEDYYGHFPINCPNGSGHSIRLGNNQAGTQAEGISYDFTIPANQNTYSIVYNYAVVFQDPNHEEFQQPRMEIEVMNVTDHQLISCSSFTFIPYGSLLPGFFESDNPDGDTPVWCKNWTAVSVNLDGMAGKTIRLFFKTADCTFRRHFGYAYIDVNSECNSNFIGAAYCPDDTVVHVTAPFGYQSYTWYNSTFTQVLGNNQTLSLAPPPPSGTVVAVEVLPYLGYGCPETLYAHLEDTLTVTANAGPDAHYCNDHPVQIGSNSKPGLTYRWTPVTGLSNPLISNPLASPLVNTRYVLEVRHDGGGCLSIDTVLVTSSAIDNSLELIGDSMYCITSGDSSILKVHPTDYIQWYRDGSPISGATQTVYRVTQSGVYYAEMKNNAGCSTATIKQRIIIDIPKPGIRYPVKYAVNNLPLTLQARDIGISALWKPSLLLDNPAGFRPRFTGDHNQQYTIDIISAGGCLTVDTQVVKTVPFVEIYVPSAFTPNGDGKNDYLFPTLMGIKELHYFRIFNRWGQLLYASDNPEPGWDGSFKGQKQDPQTVVWEAEGLGVDDNLYKRKGTTIVIR